MKTDIEPEEVCDPYSNQRYFYEKNYFEDTRKHFHVVYQEFIYDDEEDHAKQIDKIFESLEGAKKYLKELKISIKKAEKKREIERKIKKARQDKIEIRGYKKRNNLTDNRIKQELQKKDSELNNILKFGRPVDTSMYPKLFTNASPCLHNVILQSQQ